MGIEFVHVLCNGIGRKGFTDDIFCFRKACRIAISTRRGCIDKAFGPVIACREEHVEEAGNIHSVGGCRVVEATGYRTQCGLVEDDFYILTGFHAVGRIPDIAHHKAETGVVDKTFKVMEVAGGEIIETGDGIPLFEHVFAEVGADKASPAGDQNRFV